MFPPRNFAITFVASAGTSTSGGTEPSPPTYRAIMARYYFNTYEGDTISYEDDVGEEAGSRAEAWEIATRCAAECLRDLDGKLRLNSHWRLEVLKSDRRSRAFQITIRANGD